jgi:hypothetical protein
VAIESLQSANSSGHCLMYEFQSAVAAHSSPSPQVYRVWMKRTHKNKKHESHLLFNVGEPLHRERGPFKSMGEDEVVQER